MLFKAADRGCKHLDLKQSTRPFCSLVIFHEMLMEPQRYWLKVLVKLLRSLEVDHNRHNWTPDVVPSTRWGGRADMRCTSIRLKKTPYECFGCRLFYSMWWRSELWKWSNTCKTFSDLFSDRMKHPLVQIICPSSFRKKIQDSIHP